jgi:hypothetical protein
MFPKWKSYSEIQELGANMTASTTSMRRKTFFLKAELTRAKCTQFSQTQFDRVNKGVGICLHYFYVWFVLQR